MMRLFSRASAFAILAGASLSAPTLARASTVFSWSGCGGQNFASCATVIASWNSGLKQLTFDVTNTNATPGWPGRFSVVGFSGLGGTLASSGSQTAPDGWSYFTGDAQGLDGPAGRNWFGFWRSTPPGIPASNTRSFTILFTVAPPSFNSFRFGLREIGWDDKKGEFAYNNRWCGSSNRLHVLKQTIEGNAVYSETLRRSKKKSCYPDDPPTAVVPEPASMVLLATGLIGLAGVQYRRRKNGKV